MAAMAYKSMHTTVNSHNVGLDKWINGFAHTSIKCRKVCYVIGVKTTSEIAVGQYRCARHINIIIIIFLHCHHFSSLSSFSSLSPFSSSSSFFFIIIIFLHHHHFSQVLRGLPLPTVRPGQPAALLPAVSRVEPLHPLEASPCPLSWCAACRKVLG